MLIFINIMERPISDIFSQFVFNNIMEVTFIFSPRVFRHRTVDNKLTIFVSIAYKFAEFSLFIANYFSIYNIMERRGIVQDFGSGVSVAFRPNTFKARAANPSR